MCVGELVVGVSRVCLLDEGRPSEVDWAFGRSYMVCDEPIMEKRRSNVDTLLAREEVMAEHDVGGY